jgi:hypothetical protein
LRKKAIAYDDWHLTWHQPDYGGTVEAIFTDDTLTEPFFYEGWGDSTFHTALYMGSQAFRYYVTGEAEAKANAIKMVNVLSTHLHITGTQGYLARYWAPQTSLIYQVYGMGQPFDQWCNGHWMCHAVDSGPYAGDFWWGETSNDHYSGYFFGMVAAYDHIDDEGTRAIIREDVTDILYAFLDNHWFIITDDGTASGVAGKVWPYQSLTWLLAGYHITGDDRIKQALQVFLKDENHYRVNLMRNNSFFQYYQYFGNNLLHLNWYVILRLGQAYFSPADFSFYRTFFNESVHTYTRLSHNPWYNSVFMSQGGWAGEISFDDPYYGQLVNDLEDFRNAPNRTYFLPKRTGYPIDPVSKIFARLGITGEMSTVPLPIREQCSTDFLWQRNPYELETCGAPLPQHVQPGVDYLLAYWIATYHKYVGKGM